MKLRKCLLRTILFYSCYLQHNAKGQTWNKNIWTVTRPNEKSRINNLVKWDRGERHKHTKQASLLAFSAINRNWRLGLRLRSPCAGVATGLLKTTTAQLKNRQKRHSIDTCLKTHSKFSSSWTQKVTWLNTHSTTALDTGMQRQNKTYAATSKLSVRIKDANCVANAKTKIHLKLVCQTFHFAYEIQQNFII